MSAHTARAIRWDQGWELHFTNGEGVTQASTLADAEREARDYLATDIGGEPEDYTVTIRPDLAGLEDTVVEVRAAITSATEAQQLAAKRSRDIARQLRGQGLSVTDTAAVLGVTRGRVSQLTKA